MPIRAKQCGKNAPHVWRSRQRKKPLIEEPQKRLILDSLLLGVVGALAAQLFIFLLRLCQTIFLTWLAGYKPPELPQEGGVLQEMMGPHGLWLVPLATTLGGLLSGVLVYSLAPEAEGHGTDTVVRAFHRRRGFIRMRVAPLKMIASAITIGSGGAAGREGPTALISAGLGSIYASAGHRTDEERRLLALIGMSAGLSAIFRSPIGTALFAIEVLYGGMELEGGALLYAMLASVVAYVLNGIFVGWQPLFYVSANLRAPVLSDYAWYGALGVASGLVATLLPVVFYGLRDLFHALPFLAHVKPALGGLGVGLLALEWPQVLGGGYGWIQQAIDGHLAVELLLILLFAKTFAFGLTVSSGGSGGVFAPSLYVGAMLGGFLAGLFHQPPAPFVIIGMAAVFGGAARVPVATLLMVTEMTGGYQLLVPAALAVTLSYLAQVKLSTPFKYKSLYEAQVPSKADSPAHHVEHLRIALALLGKHQIPHPATIGHLDLVALLDSGIPIDFPDGKQLMLGVLRADSSCAGQSIKSGCLTGADDDVEIVAILRGQHMILPHPDTLLLAGDKVMVIGSSKMLERVLTYLAPYSPEAEKH